MPSRPRKSSPRRAKGRTKRCAECAALRDRFEKEFQFAEDVIKQRDAAWERTAKLTAERDEARKSLEVETTISAQRYGAIARLEQANAALTEDCFQIRKSRDEAAEATLEALEKIEALREEIALLRANARL